MELIDDNGDLLGVVNVIDALVVLVLLAVLVAGVALVTGGGDSGSSDEPEDQVTTYATIELGTQPDYVIDGLENGTVATIDGTDDNLTVTDVVTNRYEVTIRAEVNGTAIEDDHGRAALEVADEPLRLGRSVGLDMGTYATNGTVTAIGDDPALPFEATTTTADVELQNVSPTVGSALEDGMVVTDRGETVATLDEFDREPATVVLRSDDGELHEREHPRREDVTLTLELRTVESENGLYYQGQKLGVGETVVLEFERLTVEGEVSRLA